MTMRQRHGQATDKGNRPKNQDRLMAHQLSTHQHCFGVFDGHGENGEKVADYVAAEMAKRLDAELKALGDDGAKSVDRVSAMLQRVFDAIDEDLLSSEDIDTYMSGSTAIIALFLPNGQLVVAGCGDSRALLVRQRDGPGSDVADFEQLSTYVHHQSM
jgi:serine/threonine protein phosphatase PrpC